jgi:hypothetical protein
MAARVKESFVKQKMARNHEKITRDSEALEEGSLVISPSSAHTPPCLQGKSSTALKTAAAEWESSWAYSIGGRKMVPFMSSKVAFLHGLYIHDGGDIVFLVRKEV